MAVPPDDAYTEADHAFRDNDAYAKAKYAITLAWLNEEQGRLGRVMYHIGCGVGVFNQMAVDAGFSVVAYEPDPPPFRIAMANRPTGKCEVINGSLLDITEEAVADVIVVHDVLEHIEDDSAAVLRLSRILKPDGTMVLSVPALQSLFGYHDEQLGHFRRYSRRSLRAVLGPIFRVERLRYFGMSLIPVAAWYSKYRRVEYPTATAGRPSLTSRAFASLCRAEARVPLPIGTSLVCQVRHGIT